MACCVQGYESAIEAEQIARNVAYLGQPEYVCGEPLNNLTPHLFGVLTVARSPFVCGGPITPATVAQFLWACHRDYAPPAWHRFTSRRLRKRISVKCSTLDLAEAHSEITAFLDLTFMDAPKSGKLERPVASNTAWLNFRFRHEPWKFSEEKTMHAPFRILYQELRCWTKENTEETLTNQSDRKIQDWQEEVNRQRNLWDNGDAEQGILPHMAGLTAERLEAWNKEQREKTQAKRGNN